MPSAHTYHRFYYHLIVHTKHRLPQLVGPLRELVWDALQQKAAAFGVHPIAMNGSETHFHLLFRTDPTCSLTGFVGAAKGVTSFTINRQLEGARKSIWRTGYALFTISYGHVERVRGYIRKQARHHGCEVPLSARYTAEELSPWAGQEPTALMPQNVEPRRVSRRAA